MNDHYHPSIPKTFTPVGDRRTLFPLLQELRERAERADGPDAAWGQAEALERLLIGHDGLCLAFRDALDVIAYRGRADS